MTWDCFRHHIKTVNRYRPRKQIRFKTSMLRSDLCDFSDAYIAVKGTITVTNPDNAKQKKQAKRWHLNTMHHLSTAFQKLMVRKLAMQKT